MNTKYKVELSEEQKQNLEKITSSGTYPARQIKRAQILLKSNTKVNWSYEQISDVFDVSEVTIAKVRKTFVQSGLETALHQKKPDREFERALDGEAEAHLIALACSETLTGREHWSLRLLQKRYVKLGYADSISHETIRRVLKKNELKPWLKDEWCIPPRTNAAFVCQMEDVLDVYKRLYDVNRPLICKDEMPKSERWQLQLPTC